MLVYARAIAAVPPLSCPGSTPAKSFTNLIMPRGRAARRKQLSDAVANPPQLSLVPDVFSEGSQDEFTTNPIVFLPFGRTVSLPVSTSWNANHLRARAEARTMPPPDRPPADNPISFNSPSSLDPIAASSRFRRKRLRQSERWRNAVLPQLIEPYHELLRLSHSLRATPPLPQSDRCASCTDVTRLSITCVSFTGKLFVFRFAFVPDHS